MAEECGAWLAGCLGVDGLGGVGRMAGGYWTGGWLREYGGLALGNIGIIFLGGVSV